MKAVKKKHLPFAKPSIAAETRASHALLGEHSSDSFAMLFPEILLPTALCSPAYKSGNNPSCTVDLSSDKTLCCVTVSMPVNVIAFFLEYSTLEDLLG